MLKVDIGKWECRGMHAWTLHAYDSKWLEAVPIEAYMKVEVWSAVSCCMLTCWNLTFWSFQASNILTYRSLLAYGSYVKKWKLNMYKLYMEADCVEEAEAYTNEVAYA